MNYDGFIAEIKKYWDLRSKGLKKQANSFLFKFMENFDKDVAVADADDILEQAYAHEQCDKQMVDLYFNELVNSLWWGGHHFPESCLITQAEFEDIVKKADKVLSEKSVSPQLVADFEYYVKLYNIYFEQEDLR